MVREVIYHCSRYRIEFDRWKAASAKERLETEDALGWMLMSPTSDYDLDLTQTLTDLYNRELNPFGELDPWGGLSAWDPHASARQEAMAEELLGQARAGHLVIRKTADLGQWSDQPLVRQLDAGPRLELPREPVFTHDAPARVVEESTKETWFSAQFVDECGRWIGGLGVKLEVGGATHQLATDGAGVVRLDGQTATMAVVSVADLAQAEQLLEQRGECLEQDSPTGEDVVDYPLVEPAKTRGRRC